MTEDIFNQMLDELAVLFKSNEEKLMNEFYERLFNNQ